MIHIHARTPDGVPSYEVEDFRAITEAILGRGRRRDHQLLDRRDRRPDREADRVPARAAAGRGRAEHELDELREVLARRKDFVFKAVFENSFDTIIEFLEAMNELGIRPEHECFDAGHVANLDPLIDMGLLEEPLQISCVMGVTGGIRPTPRNLGFMADQIPGGPEGPQQLGRDRHQPRPVAARGRGRRARRQRARRASRTTSTCRTARWRARTAT